MKDILFIGGPKTVQGVDRIDDDLLSILTAEGLYDRKAVVVWPTEKFVSLPPNSEMVAQACVIGADSRLIRATARFPREVRPSH